MSTGMRLNLKSLDKAMEKAMEAAQGGRLAKAMGEAMVAATVQRFADGQGPDGKPWAPTHRGGQTLVDTGRLRRSIGYEATPTLVAWGTNLDYAETHQEGKAITAKKAKYLKFQINGRWASKKEVIVPARPFLGINDDDIKTLEETAVNLLAEVFGRKS